MNFKSILLLLLVMLAALYSSFDGTYKYISYRFPTLSTEITGGASNNSLKLDLDTPKDTVSTNSQTEQQETDQTTVPTATPESALGKITTRLISPYGANTSYNNVFLKNNTGTSVDLKGLLKQKLSFTLSRDTAPQVLIVHTHTTESFMNEKRDYYLESDNPRSTDLKKNMVVIGEVFAQKLQAAGIGVIHDKTLHDHPSYTGSYNRSAETINKHLKANPTIKIVVDIHRDAITDSNKTKTRPIAKINGKDAAQVMLVMGSETGGITNFPKWKENLSLAVKYQQTMEVMYPSLARAITLNSAKYNQNLTTGSILLEVGSEANTFSEAEYAAECAATALVGLLNTIKE